MPDDIDDLTEALKGLLGTTWEYGTDGHSTNRISIFPHSPSLDGVIKIENPIGTRLSPSFYIGKPDPIHQNLALVPRANAPEKCIYIQFEQSRLCIYEEGEFGSKHLRFAINYSNIQAILAVANNQLLTPEQINLLELVSELRSAQASLFETGLALNEARRHEAVARDNEISRLKALLTVAEEKAKRVEKDNFQLRLEKREVTQELDELKENIQKRQRELAQFELFDATDDV